MAAKTQVAEGEIAQGRARVRLRCWGDFALSDSASGDDLKPRGRKARAMLAYLALHPGKAVSRERLAGLLWGDRAEEQARASLRQAILELRPLANGALNALLVERDYLTLRENALATDLDELRDAAARRDHRALLAALPDTDDLLFANLEGTDEGFDDWLRIERTRQRDALLDLLSRAAAAAALDQSEYARELLARRQEFDSALAPPPFAGVVAPTGRAEERQPPSEQAQAVPPSSISAKLPLRTIGALTVLLLVLCLAGIVLWQQRQADPAPAATIAVLPFSDLSGRDPYFAEGLSEEVMAQLAREPGLRVAGRTSSAQFKGRTADLEEVGRKLGVTYVLEGSVRSAGSRVRVNVALAQASDGLQLWSQTFNGTLEDVLGIQHQIGARVAGALGRKLTQARPSGSQATSGAVYSLYLRARGLIRERNPRAMIAAGELLERALALDPRFAPALSSMAQVKRWEGNNPGAAGEKARGEALALARRALALAPDLAESHGVLGMILGFEDPAGQRHLKRAAALDPHNAEFQFWLGHAFFNESDFPSMLAAYRRALTLDPLWNRSQHYAVLTAWRMENREEAIGYVRRVEREGSRYDASMLRGLLATTTGDLSGAALEFGRARAATADVGKQAPAVYNRGGILFQLGMVDEARKEWTSCRSDWAKKLKRPLGMPELHAAHFALKRGKFPTAAELATVNASGEPGSEYLVAAMAKRLIRAGRARDVVASYESGEGLLGLYARRPRPLSVSGALRGAPIIASALRAVGRGGEADRLLRDSERTIAEGLGRSHGRAPADFYGEAAQTWALLGKHDQALAGLERARRNGWMNANLAAGDLVDDIADEPAFQSLRGDPRFEAIRARMNAHLDRERRELTAGVLTQASSVRIHRGADDLTAL